MFLRHKIILAIALFVVFFAIGTPMRTAIAAGQSGNAPAQANPPAVTPNPAEVAAASPEAIRLLRLMDTDKSGKISHAEYIAFMEAEFQRLDVDHDGELDLKELEKSQFAVAHHGGTRR